MKGIHIKNKQKMSFCRHAESFGNVGIACVDAPLTDNGISQAKLLEGHYDCIIVSPMRRTLETLHYSKITWDNLIVCENFREVMNCPHDFKLLEDRNKSNDTDQTFFNRVWKFHAELEEICGKYNNILLIGHAYFFNAWYRQGCYPSPEHAKIIDISG